MAAKGKGFYRRLIPAAGVLLMLSALLAGLSQCGLPHRASGPTRDQLAASLEDAWEFLKAGETDSAALLYASIAGHYSGFETDSLMLNAYGVAMVNMGYIWLFKHNNAEQAFVWLQRGSELGEKHNLRAVKVGAYDNLGKIYTDYHCYEQGEKFYRSALYESLKIGNDWEVIMCFNDLLNLALTQGEIQMLSKDLDKVSRFTFKDPNMKMYADALLQGLRQWLDGDPGKGVETITASEPDMSGFFDSERYLVNHKILLAEMLISSGHAEEGIGQLTEAKALAERENLTDMEEIVYSLLAEAFRNGQQPDSAAFYDHQALLIRDSLYNARNLGRIRDLEVSAVHDTLQRDVLREQTKARQTYQTVWIVGVFSLVVIVFAVWLAVNLRKVRRVNRELYKRNMELANLRRGSKVTVEPRQPETESGKTNDGDPQTMETAENLSPGRRAAAIMASSEEIYSPDFTIERLAVMTGMKPRLLGEALMETTGKSFKSLLTEYRVREACRLFSDKTISRKFSIEGVAEKVGYRSRTHFSRVFKEVTGLTASEFVKQAHSSQNSN